MHVRNTSEPRRDTWAAYVTAVREAATLPKSRLAARLGVDRATVARWENGSARPGDSGVVVAFAELFGLDIDEALTAAGLRPGATPAAPRAAALEDPVIEIIRENGRLSDREKETLIRRERERIEKDRQRRREDLDWYLQQREADPDSRDTA